MPDSPKYSENDLIRMMTRAGQIARGHDLEFARQLGVEGEPLTPHLLMTREEVEALVNEKVYATFAQVNLPARTEDQRSDTGYKIKKVFDLEEDSRQFKRRTLWGILAGFLSLVVGLVAAALGIRTGIH